MTKLKTLVFDATTCCSKSQQWNGQKFPPIKENHGMSPPKLKKAGDGSKQQTETIARFIWNAKVSGNYYYFSAAAILTLTTLILVLPQTTLELTKITKISTAYAEISIPYKWSLWCGCCQKVC